VEDLIESQQADQRCLDARDGLITATGVYYDYQGVLGQVLPSGEFAVMFPSSCPTEANVKLFAELPFPTSLARGDARRLRRGDASSVRSSVRYMAQTPSDEVVVLSTTPIPAAVQIE
jgi:hypothetical protein